MRCGSNIRPPGDDDLFIRTGIDEKQEQPIFQVMFSSVVHEKMSNKNNRFYTKYTAEYLPPKIIFRTEKYQKS